MDSEGDRKAGGTSWTPSRLTAGIIWFLVAVWLTFGIQPRIFLVPSTAEEVLAMLKRHIVRLTDKQHRGFETLARGGQATHDLADVRILLNTDPNDLTCWMDQRINESLDVGVSTGTRARRLYCTVRKG